MNRMKGNVNACMIGVGGALPVLVGARKRAPLWMQQAALEWLYRFMQEPFRLGPRYFKTNLIFLRMFFTDGLKTLLAPAPYSPPLKERRLEKSAVSEQVEA